MSDEFCPLAEEQGKAVCTPIGIKGIALLLRCDFAG